MVCCANGIGCTNQGKEKGLAHFPKQPDGTYVKTGYTAVNSMIAKSFGRFSKNPKKRRDESKTNIPRKDGRTRKRADGKRTVRKGKGSGKKRRNKSRGRNGSPAPP